MIAMRSCRLISFSLLFSFACGLALAIPGCESPPPPEGKRIGDLCPDIVGTTPDGKQVKLSDYRGKVVLVSFWGTWCGPCKAMLPGERSKVQGLSGRPFAMIGVASDPPDRLRDFLKIQSLPWPNIADGDHPGPIVRDWKIDRYPSAILVDPAGIIVGEWFGGLDFDELWESVERAVRAAQR